MQVSKSPRILSAKVHRTRTTYGILIWNLDRIFGGGHPT